MASQEQQALNQIRKILPLDDESLNQLLGYSQSLPPVDAAEHLKSVLGDSPQALEFISTFNSKRTYSSGQNDNGATSASAPVTGQSSNGADNGYSGVPKSGPKKKKQPGLKKLPPVRRVEGDTEGAYVKRELEEYMPQHKKHKDAMASAFALHSGSSSLQPTPLVQSRESSPARIEQRQTTHKLLPSAAGRLISDPKPKTAQSGKSKVAKVSIAGGTPMHGASTALSDLDDAIRELEIQTNPTRAPTAKQNAKRKCNCMATRHDLLAAAPNCVNCGKIICVKEGIGPCTFCGKPILSSAEIDSMLRVLKDERGIEKMNANNAAHRRADVATAARPFTTPKVDDNGAEKLSQAMQHRDRLLAFQTQNAKRTRIHDEAADFETPTAGLNAWASPAERALQLRKQQKAFREQQWNAKPDWEKRKMVASIDLVGGKVVRRMATIERPQTPDSDTESGDDFIAAALVEDNNGSERTFGRNPLLGMLIKPVARAEKGKGKSENKVNTWRRVQDSQEDNEDWVLGNSAQGG